MLNRYYLNKYPFAIFFAPDLGGSNGGENKPLSLEDRLAKVTGDLTAAQATLATLTSERDTLHSDLASARLNVTNLQSQFDALNTTATQLRSDLQSAQSALSVEQTAHSAAKGLLTVAQGNVSRLEKLCGLKGIDPAAAIPEAPAPDGSLNTLADFEARMQSAKTPEARAKIAAECSKAIEEGKLKK